LAGHGFRRVAFVAHDDQMRYVGPVKQALPRFFTGQCVLEVGSLDLNGSIRQHFTFTYCDYTGLDVAPVPGVDVAVPGWPGTGCGAPR
jgi:hypothetical protein